MSDRQRDVLRMVADEPHTALYVARGLDTTIRLAERVLAALVARSWVTRDEHGRYHATDRGRRRVRG